MAKYITEVLKELNENVKLFETEYKKSGNGGPLGVLFKHAYEPENRFLLPEGEPPFKPSSEPIGMTPVPFISQIQKFKNFVRQDISNTKREMVFVQMLESIHPDEAKILLAVKDQKLHELYPKLTHEVIMKAGFIRELSKEEIPVKKSKRTPRKKKDLLLETHQDTENPKEP